MNLTHETSDFLKTITQVISCLVTTFAIIFAYFQYKMSVKQKRMSVKQKRVELFEKYRTKFETDKFLDIFTLLEKDDDKLISATSYQDKIRYLGFYEEIALLVNSGLLKPRVAHYMFGYGAIKCLDSDKFWRNGDLDKDGPYWKVFRDFATYMKELEKENKTITTIRASYTNCN